MESQFVKTGELRRLIREEVTAALQDLNLDLANDTTCDKGSSLDGTQIGSFTGSSTDGRQHGETAQVEPSCDCLHKRFEGLMNKHTERIIKLVNEQSTLLRDLTKASTNQALDLPSLPSTSSRPKGLIESGSNDSSRISSSVCEPLEAPVQPEAPLQLCIGLCDIFDGEWEDLDGKLYGGTLIVFQGNSWWPRHPPEEAQRTAKFELQPLADTQCYLYENRADGSSRRFLATADPSHPDRLKVALADSHLNWTLRRVSQEELDKRSTWGTKKLKVNAKTLNTPETSIVGKAANYIDQYANTSVGSLYERYMDWVEKLHEPERIGRLAMIVECGSFKLLCTAIIVIQAVYSTIAINESMEKAAQGDTYEDNTLVEAAFLAFYTVEVILRLRVHGFYFFVGEQWTWNLFDLALVAQSCVDLCVTLAGLSGTNMAYLRPLRFFKVAKVLRTLRALKYFSEVRLMMVCIVQSMSTLFWCLALIFFIQYLFSMLFVQGMAEYLTASGDMSSDARSEIQDAFGSVQKAVIVLWMVVTGGDDWGGYYRMIDQTSLWRGRVFLFYIAFFVIAALNIITGTFVEKAFDLAKPDAEMIMAEQRERDTETYNQLRALFKHANTRKTGSLSKDEFLTVVGKEHNALLEIMGVTHVDSESLFELMKDGCDGEVALETFTHGMMHLSGDAKCVDVHLLEHRILMLLNDIHYALNSMSGSLTRQIISKEGYIGA